MHARYHPIECNIVGCERSQSSLLLCKAHEAEYVASPATLRLQQEIVALLERRAGTRLRVRAYLWSTLHYVTNLPVPFVEHFPLESLYLYHRRRLFDRMGSKGSNQLDDCARLQTLIRDFGHADNETLEDLKWRSSWYCNDSQHAYNRSLDFSVELRQAIPFVPRTFARIATLTFTLYVAAALANKHAGTLIALPGSLSVMGAFLWFAFCAGLVLGGLVVLHRLGPLMAKAQSHKLYAVAADNVSAAAIGLRVKSNFSKHLGLAYSTMASSAIGALMLCLPWGLEGGLGAIDYVASALLSVCAWLVLFPTLRMYEQYANASVALEALPQARFRVDLHSQDGRLGIGEVIDVVAAGVLFNVTALAVFWIAIPVALARQYVDEPLWIRIVALIAYQLFIFFLALPRVVQLRRLWRVRRKIIESIRFASVKEVEAARAKPVAERQARQQSLERVRSFPLLTNSARRHLKEFVVTLVIPLAMLIADKIYSAYQPN